MGEEDVRRQALNVFRMRMLGAKVVAVASGTKTLKDAISASLSSRSGPSPRAATDASSLLARR